LGQREIKRRQLTKTPSPEEQILPNQVGESGHDGLFFGCQFLLMLTRGHEVDGAITRLKSDPTSRLLK
jgi:hypothetical protein